MTHLVEVSSVAHDPSQDDSAATRPIGFWGATGLVISSMVGAGVFTTSGYALADLGSPGLVLTAWVIGGVIALCGAVCYGALASRFSESGGEYLFLARAVHPLAGFQAGWISMIAGFTGGIALAAVALAKYLAEPLSLTAGWQSSAVALGAVWLAAAAHSVSVRPGVLLQTLLVAMKLAVLAVVIASGLQAAWRGEWAVQQPVTTVEVLPPAPGTLWLSMAMSVTWISLSYCGFNAAIYVASEVRDAGRTVPRAMLLGTAVVTLLYLALNGVFVLGPPMSVVSGQEDVAVVACRALGGAALAELVRVGIVLGLATSVSAMMLAGPRVYARMADDGVLPLWFRFAGKVPRWGILFQAAAASGLILSSGLRDLLTWLGFTLSLSAAATVSVLFLLRRRPGEPAIVMPGYPWPAVVFVGGTLISAGLTLWREPWQCVAGLVVIAAGFLVWPGTWGAATVRTK